MEAPEEASPGAQDQSHIVKGKRTKRVRPQSPIPKSHDENNNNNNNNNNSDENSAAATCCAEFKENHHHHHNTEEEEDMANCLILLAQGQSRESPRLAEEEDGRMTTTMNKCDNNRRLMESHKAGFYHVYECKTCNKSFPSFQALGGHRASHRKPKALAIAEPEKKMKEEGFELFKNNNNNSNDNNRMHSHSHNRNNNNTFSLQLFNSGIGNSKSKVHECSICGAEFASGQALGGHMRRHRTANTTSSDHYHHHEEHHHHQPRKKKNVLSLDLDLNLPAPEDDHRERESSSSKFAFESNNQQKQQEASLGFSSAPALVDCHY